MARSASRPGSRSPAISASIIARPETPSSLLATESILTPAPPAPWIAAAPRWCAARSASCVTGSGPAAPRLPRRG
jgi:hypothetical protein